MFTPRILDRMEYPFYRRNQFLENPLALLAFDQGNENVTSPDGSPNQNRIRMPVSPGAGLAVNLSPWSQLLQYLHKLMHNAWV